MRATEDEHKFSIPSAIVRGTIERITFHNPDNGFCVLRVAVSGMRDHATVVGNATQVLVGEEIEAHGEWIIDRTYGKQLKATKIKMSVPSSTEGIKKYLASGVIKGVGKHYAKLLVETFQERVIDILDEAPELIRSVPGIGEVKYQKIVTSWQEQKGIRQVMLFLQDHGVGGARATRIYKTYGEETISKLKANPYCLALDIWGIGFKIADDLAQSIGIPKDSLIRAEAGVRHVLHEHSRMGGHCAIVPNELLKQCVEMLEINEDTIIEAVANEVVNGNIVQEVVDNTDYIAVAPLYYAEVGVANSITKLMQHDNKICDLSDDEIITIAEHASKIRFSESQEEAILMAIKNKVSIITGGPGVGKTTIVRNIIKILRHLGKDITLCAPTGRAAKRLSESSGFEAKTIHRLLGYRVGGGARYDQNFPLETDFLIIDETSMVDIALMNTLLKAVPKEAGVLFVGDVDQLPSVGPGSVLGDMIKSNVIATTRLVEVYRQAKTSPIITNAHKINNGDMPYHRERITDDFCFFAADEPQQIVDTLLRLVNVELPELHQVNPAEHIQVLVPMNRGEVGVRNLNILLQQHLNNNYGVSVSYMGTTYRIGDKVIQTVNNYNKDVFNGDIGFIVAIDVEEEVVQISFDDKIVEYEKNELDEIDLAYAISIHKSQGSEYPIIVIPIAMQHYPLLQRNLLYTGVTRGKSKVVLIGQKKAFFIAVKKESVAKRITNLEHKLKNALL